jgi:hypothetical protein
MRAVLPRNTLPERTLVALTASPRTALSRTRWCVLLWKLAGRKAIRDVSCAWPCSKHGGARHEMQVLGT